MIENIKLLLGVIDNSKDDLINLLISLTTQKIKNYCNISDVLSTDLDPIIAELVVLRYSQLGSENLKSETEGEVSKTYLIEDFPADIKKQLARFRRVIFK